MTTRRTGRPYRSAHTPRRATAPVNAGIAYGPDGFADKREPIVINYPDRLTYGLLLKLIQVFERRGCVVCPSDTCYGVLGVATDPDAVNLIDDLTGRRTDPLPVAVDSVTYAAKLIDIRDIHEEVIAHAWPGAYTAVAPAKGSEGQYVSKLMHASGGTLGVRVPGRETFESALSSELKRPIVTTAVRYPDGRPVRDGKDALRIVTEAMSMRGTDPELVAFIARDQFRYDTHSTVGRMVQTERLVELIREGAMPWHEIEALVRRLTKRSWEDPEAQEDIT